MGRGDLADSKGAFNSYSKQNFNSAFFVKPSYPNQKRVSILNSSYFGSYFIGLRFRLFLNCSARPLFDNVAYFAVNVNKGYILCKVNNTYTF